MDKLFAFFAVLLLAVPLVLAADEDRLLEQKAQVTNDVDPSIGPSNEVLPVISPAISNAMSCSLSPSSIVISVGNSTWVSASCSQGGNEVECPEVFWSTTIGEIMPRNKEGPAALFVAGNSSGTGKITLSGTDDYRPLRCFADVQVTDGNESVQAPPVSLSGAGSNNGGGTFRTSTTVSISCAGKPSQIKVTYYVSPPPKAVVGIFYKGGGAFTKVYSASIESTSTFSFTPGKTGDYELHVSIGADQTTKSFSVAACAPNATNATQQVVTVNLQPSRELILSRTVSYDGGFSKDFKVYKLTSQGTEESYVTEITLRYFYGGEGVGKSMTISDSAPRQVVSKSSQIVFDKYPSFVAPDPEVRFEWTVPSGNEEQVLSYGYRFSRPLTEQMIAAFAPPRALARSEQGSEEAGIGTDLAASLIANGLFGFSLVSIAVAILALILLAMILGVVFGRKRS